MISLNPISGETIFEFRGKSISQVFLVGHFRQQRPSIIPMQWKCGRWIAQVFLPAGRYAFGFEVDGEFQMMGVAEIKLDYRELADCILQQLALTHNCLCHAPKWN